MSPQKLALQFSRNEGNVLIADTLEGLQVSQELRTLEGEKLTFEIILTPEEKQQLIDYLAAEQKG